MEADTFTRVKEFMELIEGTPWFRVGCVVFDVQDGLKIQKRLTRGRYKTPMIFMTADNKPGVRDRALDAGAVAVLYKPFEPELFIKALQQATKPSAHWDTHAP